MKKQLLLSLMLIVSMSITMSAQQLYPIKDHQTGLYGYKYEGNDKWIVKPKYLHAGYFHEGRAYIIKGKGHHKDNSVKHFAGYIDEKGKLVIPLKFEWANDFHEGLAVVKIWDDTSIFHVRYGYIDTLGHFVLPPIYDYADEFRNGRAKVKWVDGQGYTHVAYIDENGEYSNDWLEGRQLPMGQTRPRWK